MKINKRHRTMALLGPHLARFVWRRINRDRLWDAFLEAMRYFSEQAQIDEQERQLPIRGEEVESDGESEVGSDSVSDSDDEEIGAVEDEEISFDDCRVC